MKKFAKTFPREEKNVGQESIGNLCIFHLYATSLKDGMLFTLVDFKKDGNWILNELWADQNHSLPWGISNLM